MGSYLSGSLCILSSINTLLIANYEAIVSKDCIRTGLLKILKRELLWARLKQSGIK